MAERFKREIEEILQQSEKPAGPGRPRRGGKGPSRGSPLPFFRIQKLWSPGRLFVVSVALLLSALILNTTGSRIVSLFFWLGLVLSILAYALFIVRSEKRPERRWRGQVVDDERRPSWRSRFRRWRQS
jgi:hypothetical protein